MQINSLLLLLAWALGLCCFVIPKAKAEEILFDFRPDFDTQTVEARDAQLTLSRDRANVLRIATGHAIDWPGITLKAPQGHWDLSNYEYLALDVRNVGANRVEVFCRVDNPGADGARNCVTESIGLEPEEEGSLQVTLVRRLPENMADKLFGMRGYPGGLVKDRGIDARIVNQLIVFVAKPEADHVFQISHIRVGGSYTPPGWLSMGEGEFFPLIDEYGQFVHKDWPGKTKSTEDLNRHREEEAADLAKHGGPGDWDEYGGWKAGPRRDETGYFRVEKYEGKWWLVDPAGRLFWSHGIDCVGSDNGVTPITDRWHWFQDLPEVDSALHRFYGEGRWAPHGYYKGKTYETFNFTGANLFRKYGRGWMKQFEGVCHRRLRSWGMNTIGNWSSSDIYLLRRTPYVVAIHFGGKPIEGSEGYWGQFRDVFDPSFEEALRDRLAQEKGGSAKDPWCIGYFVDNELSWGDDTSLAIAALASPPEQSAKRTFIGDLRAKYGTVEQLNQTWGTRYASWDDMLESRQAPDQKKACADLVAFYIKTAETYFRMCRDAVKEVAPNNLYLGCRFAWVNERVLGAAAKYCDVISYNLYWGDIGTFGLPEGIDKPVIVGEFHFGALDRGMFHTGLQKVKDQARRAEAYKRYVRSALRNPCIVGTHWFQYGDQATTGRGDGENYQIGFLDIVDTPYAETINACREVGYGMYPYRLSGE